MKKAELFKNIKRPNEKLYFQSHDKKDRKIGSVVARNQNNYPNSRYVLIGCPQDIGVKRNNGRVGAARAPDKIREVFYKLNAPANLKDGELFDIGNTLIAKSLEETHNIHEQIISHLLSDGKTVIVLGGGNDISYPDCKALSSQVKGVLALNIDSHFDVRENKKRNSGTPYRQLLEEVHIKPNDLYELAYQEFANSDIYVDYLKRKKVTIKSLNQLRSNGISKTIKSILKQNRSSAIFWGFDMDSVRAADAPGVSASYPTGLSADEIIEIAAIASVDKRSRVFEITEVNPNFDVDSRTCKLAALLIRQFISGS